METGSDSHASWTASQPPASPWGGTSGLAQSIQSRFGVLVRKIDDHNDWWRQHRDKKVVPPLDKLNKVIDKWNGVLSAIEERLLVSEDKVESYANLGADLKANLDKYRKKPKVEAQT